MRPGRNRHFLPDIAPHKRLNSEQMLENTLSAM
jgi:hypothetical protein